MQTHAMLCLKPVCCCVLLILPVWAGVVYFILCVGHAVEAHLCSHGQTAQTFKEVADLLSKPPHLFELTGKTCQKEFQKLRADHRKGVRLAWGASGTDDEAYTSSLKLLDDMLEQEDDINVSYAICFTIL